MKKEADAQQSGGKTHAPRQNDVVLTQAMRRLRHELETHPVFAEIVHVEALRSFRREMNAIARGVVDFVKKYQLSAFDQQAREEFMADYQTVYGLLAQRIEREESSLYPLYLPH